MKSKKVFSIILSLSLMFSGVSFCLAEENNEKILLIPEDNVITAFGEFKSLREKIGKHEAECGWSDVRKTPTNCNLGNFSVITYDYFPKEMGKFYKLNATWPCGKGETDNCSILGYDTKDKTGAFKINEKGYLIANNELASKGFVESISKILGMLSTTEKKVIDGYPKSKLCDSDWRSYKHEYDVCKETHDRCKEQLETCRDGHFVNKKELSILGEIKNMLKNENKISGWIWPTALTAGILGGLAWLGNLIYKKLITGKNNKNAQAQQNAQTQQPMYYYDPNSGTYYVVDEKGNVQQFRLDEQGNVQPVYQGQDPVVPQEKKEPENEEKLSNPEVTEKKENTASVTKEETPKANLDGILKDIMKDTTV